MKKSVKAEFNTFIKGLITEAGPLNFPENASLFEENFELNRKGSRSRRKGMAFEENYLKFTSAISPSDYSVEKVNTFIWNNAGDIPGNNLCVVQTEYLLDFYSTAKQYISSSGYRGSVTLPSSLSNLNGKPEYSMTSVDGRLIIAAGAYEIGVVELNNGAFSYSSFTLKTRDFWGISFPQGDEDPYYRHSEYFNNANLYNLYNQSWGVPRRWDGAGDFLVKDPTDYYFYHYNKTPSYSETVWTGMQMKASADPYEYIRPNLYGEVFGSTPTASKGYFVIDVLRRGQSRLEAVEANSARFPEMYLKTFTPNQDTTPGGAKVVCEFSGRIFYAGFGGEVIDGDSKSPALSNYVFFSQLVKSKADLGKCYQEGDPTSREAADIVDTDGGFIRLSGAQNIIRMEQLGEALIVMCDNGVWVISGGSDYGFSATNYKTQQISDYSIIGKRSVVKTGDTLFFWGYSGIYQVARTQTGYSVASITKDTIQTFYNEISSFEKIGSFGVYDSQTQTVRWVYSKHSTFTESSYYKELILDTRIPAFSSFKINNLPNTLIAGVFPINNYSEISNEERVVASGEDVLANSIQVVTSKASSDMPQSTRYLLMVLEDGAVKYSFGGYFDKSFRDWKQINGVGIDAKAVMLTGAITGGSSSIDKQVPYLTVHLQRTETGVDSNDQLINPSGCLMRSQWDWSNNISSNKWSPLYQVYRYVRGSIVSPEFDTGFELITTRNKIRGIGKAVSFYFETEPDKDCRLVGWSLNINGNQYT
jgi:hypothetical protein